MVEHIPQNQTTISKLKNPACPALERSENSGSLAVVKFYFTTESQSNSFFFSIF